MGTMKKRPVVLTVPFAYIYKPTQQSEHAGDNCDTFHGSQTLFLASLALEDASEVSAKKEKACY